MQIQDELKEILSEVFELGRTHQKRNGHCEDIEDYLEQNKDKILALGKPRPLAKNKHSGNKNCDYEECENGLIIRGRVAHKCPSCG